jgi:hypothetical protein
MVLLRDLIQAIDRLTEKSIWTGVNYCLIAIYDRIIETLYHGFLSLFINDLKSIKVL